MVNRDCFRRFRSDGKEYVRCLLCAKYPETVKLYVYNKKPPPITTEKGTLYRSDVMEKHINADYHAACERADMIKSLSDSNENLAPMDASIKKAIASQSNHIGKILIQVFMDAKILTSAAYNWPARYVANEASNTFDFSKSDQPIIPQNISLNYINPPQHEADRDNIKTMIQECLALSLRVDGSIDRSQKDKIYVLAKIVLKSGERKLVFLGMGEQTKSGAEGLFEATQNAMADMFTSEFVNNYIWPKVSSICTDGTNVNTGEKGGLWFYVEKRIAETESNIPVTKIWCVAHRSNLAFTDLSNNNRKVGKVFRILSSIASYFHSSAIRTATLKEIASKLDLKYLVMPKLFEIRWTEYTFQLLKAILNNWHALIVYFDEDGEAQAKGFRTYISDVDNLHLISFCADLLFIFRRFQKQLQSDSLTLPAFCLIVRNFISLLNSLHEKKLAGGSIFLNGLELDDGTYQLKDIELSQKSKISRRPTKSIEDIRKEIINSLNDFLISRLQIPNSELLDSIEEFLKFDINTDVTQIHTSFGKDMELSLFSMQYHDLSNTPENIRGKSIEEMLRYLGTADRFKYFTEIATVLARIFACTPHSADCERTISANNLLKTNQRMSLNISTENYYIYVHFNLPELEKWDPRPAVKKFTTDANRRISKPTKTTEQPYFKYIFQNSQRSDEIENEDAFLEDFNMNFKF